MLPKGEKVGIAYYVLEYHKQKYGVVQYYAGESHGVTILTTDFAEAKKWEVRDEAEAFHEMMPTRKAFRVEEHAWA